MKLNLVSGGALAALAAALAFAAAPASARPNHDDNDNRPAQSHEHGSAQATERSHGQWGGQQSAERSHGQWGGQQRAEQAQAQAPRQFRQEQRNWNGQRQEQRNAQQSREVPRIWGQGNTAQARTQNWGSNGQRYDRNQTYTNRDRNTTYRRDGDRNTTYRDSRNGDRNWRDGNRDNRRWDRNWRNNNRYDWQRYRSSNRNAFHVGRYYAPYRNYSYRRLSTGFFLDSLFFGSNYWISDPYEYRLPEAYGPYRWVRYYDDAVLVDIYTGEVVDVIYDFFW